MTLAGEQQYYTLALIKALFRHLPDDWVIGLLYDVACQLKHSMRKVHMSGMIADLGLNQALVQLCQSRVRSGVGSRTRISDRHISHLVVLTMTSRREENGRVGKGIGKIPEQ